LWTAGALACAEQCTSARPTHGAARARKISAFLDLAIINGGLPSRSWFCEGGNSKLYPFILFELRYAYHDPTSTQRQTTMLLLRRWSAVRRDDRLV